MREEDKPYAMELLGFFRRCPTCGHAMVKTSSIHAKPWAPKVSLSSTHWEITETDGDEPHGTGCTVCESNHAYGMGNPDLRDSPYCDPQQKCTSECCSA